MHKAEYPTLVADLLRLLPAEDAGRLGHAYQNPQHRPAEMMLALLEAFPAGDPVVVLLDNLESVMDPEHETLAEPALHEALSAVLTGPAHAITMIATTRVTPTVLLRVEPARQRQLRLTEGLGHSDARIVLRVLDDDGRLGLRDAPDDLLDGLCQHTRGYPRALEAVKAILEGDETLTPRDLLDRTRSCPGTRSSRSWSARPTSCWTARRSRSCRPWRSSPLRSLRSGSTSCSARSPLPSTPRPS